MIESMLTTTDNPHDPFTDFDRWYSFDEAAGYHSTAYLGRIVKQTEDLGDSVTTSAIEQAIDEIVEINIFGIYKKVTREVAEIRVST